MVGRFFARLTLAAATGHQRTQNFRRSGSAVAGTADARHVNELGYIYWPRIALR